MVLSHEERTQWMGFRSDWKDWKDLKDCLELMSLAKMSHTSVGYVTPQLPEASLERRNIQEEVTLADAIVHELDSPNRRKFHRVSTKLAAEIICQEQSYETYTTDVSVGGIAVEGCLPDWIAGYCTVILELPDDRKLEFMCSVVENQKGKNYRLELHPSIDTKELETWLLEEYPLKKAN